MIIIIFFFFFFFSSRRRHTRFSRDWSSDVCSSDLSWNAWKKDSSRACASTTACSVSRPSGSIRHRRSEERRVGKSVDLGGRRIIKKKKKRKRRRKKTSKNEKHDK